ncbi:SpaA isopeptide-forming pilin-related protein [Streptomyces sp. NPDC048330]|uniref:SpaA isopeptide-forming pilin-related protein n=1 Tax=Streptomyces sp. NPDC048330 TaxID=3365533 RepID=UPI0037219893
MKHHHVLPTLVLTTAAVLAAPPAAFAAPSPQPTPSASTTRAEIPVPDAGSVEITKKDPAGDVLSGATFLLLTSAGQEAGGGKTDDQGKLTFPDLAPGIYRLKETASGSPLHEVVADQDVIVTPGATARLTIVDPFKPAQVLLKAKDDKTGKLLPGSTVNIGCGEATLLTLTTGPKGTATGELPVTSKKAECWAKQVKAPAGYDLYTPSKSFTVTPGAPVTVTVTNAKTATPPKPTPTEKPTTTPSTPGDKPTDSTSGASKATPTDSVTPEADSSTAPAADATDNATPKAPAGSLAHTGAEAATPWILGGAGLLVAAGIGTLVVARRRTAAEPEHDDIGEAS